MLEQRGKVMVRPLTCGVKTTRRIEAAILPVNEEGEQEVFWEG